MNLPLTLPRARDSIRSVTRIQVAGFTLIEVLIAMAISAIVGVMAFSSLDVTSRALDVNRRYAERLSEVNRTWAVIARDLRQTIPRSVRNQYGTAQAALFGGSATQPILELTRTGWINPRKLYRSSMQRVSYHWENDSLYREYWQNLDRSTQSQPIRSLLLEGVTDFRLRFLDGSNDISGGNDNVFGGIWREDWNANAVESSSIAMPLAIEVTIEMDDWGEARRLFALATP